MSRLHKTLAALAIAVFFTLGTFVLSFAAHDSASLWPLHTIELHRVLKTGHVQLKPYALGFGVTLEMGYLPTTSPQYSVEPRALPWRLVEPAVPYYAIRLHVPKVSLQILESVLNL
jgi:hypothetical protein